MLSTLGILHHFGTSMDMYLQTSSLCQNQQKVSNLCFLDKEMDLIEEISQN